jgi:hypothetical protein
MATQHEVDLGFGAVHQAGAEQGLGGFHTIYGAIQTRFQPQSASARSSASSAIRRKALARFEEPRRRRRPTSKN